MKARELEGLCPDLEEIMIDADLFREHRSGANHYNDASSEYDADSGDLGFGPGVQVCTRLDAIAHRKHHPGLVT